MTCVGCPRCFMSTYDVGTEKADYPVAVNSRTSSRMPLNMYFEETGTRAETMVPLAIRT